MPATIAQGRGAESEPATVICAQHADGAFVGIAIPTDMNRPRAELFDLRPPRDHRVGRGKLAVFRYFHPESDRMRRVTGKTRKRSPRMNASVKPQRGPRPALDAQPAASGFGNRFEFRVKIFQPCAEIIGLQAPGADFVQRPMDVAEGPANAIQRDGLIEPRKLLLAIMYVCHAGMLEAARFILAKQNA